MYVCVFLRGSPHNGRIFDDTMIGIFFILFPGHMVFSQRPSGIVSVLSGLAWLWDLDCFPNATKTGNPRVQGTVMNSCQKQDAWGRGQKQEREWDEEVFPSETENRQEEEAQMGRLTCWRLGWGQGRGWGRLSPVNHRSQWTQHQFKIFTYNVNTKHPNSAMVIELSNNFRHVRST